MKELFAASRNNIKNNGFLPFIMFFLIGVLSAGLIALGYFSGLITLVAFPLLILPMLFASMNVTYILQNEEVLSLRLFARSFVSYFADAYRNTFQLIKGFLISILITFVLGFVYMLTINLILYYNNFMNYQGIIADIYTHLNVEPEELINLLQSYKDFFYVLGLINYLPTSFIFGISLLFFLSRSSISYHYKTDTFEKLTGRASSVIHNNMIKKNRKKFYSRYFALNWPIYPLYIIGFGLGGYIGYLTIGDSFGVISIASALGFLFVIGLFGPILLANNEAIYNSLKKEYNDSFVDLSNSLASSLEEMLKQYEKQREDATKKDSDESE